MTPNQVLKRTRRFREMTLSQMAECLGLTTQRISQMERGDPIPVERIHEWSNSSGLPEWAHQMAYEMWLSVLEQQQVVISEQIKTLRRTLLHAGSERRNAISQQSGP